MRILRAIVIGLFLGSSMMAAILNVNPGTAQLKMAANAAMATISASLPATPTVGNIVIAVLMTGNTRSVSSFTDGSSHAMTVVPGGPCDNSNRATRLFIYFLQETASPSATFTANFSGNASNGIGLMEFSGVDTSATPYDANVICNVLVTSTATPNSPTVSPVNANSLLIGGVGATTIDNTLTSPWTFVDTADACTCAFGSEFLIETTIVNQSILFHQGSSTQWAGIGAAFKPASSGTKPKVVGGGLF